MPPIVRSRLARRDLLEIWEYIAADRSSAADRVLCEIAAKIALLETTPLLGTSRDELSPGLRSLPVSNHIVFYRHGTGVVEIVRVLHGARDVTRLLSLETAGPS
ncbi:MAG: type II toxin-antitoxin system RelE/ParE family toxin [Alphaproteobacteria bacterium]